MDPPSSSSADRIRIKILVKEEEAAASHACMQAFIHETLMTYLCCTGGIWADHVVAGDLHQGYLEHIQPGRRRRTTTTTAPHSSAL
jgi:hypothetical protein